jgi:hypothetical protein
LSNYLFDAKDVADFKVKAAKEGLNCGKIWQPDGYEFANAKDPDGNSIQVSSRAFKK